MSPANAYDESLLATAPVATRTERQEGYNVDLLSKEGRTSASGSPTPPRSRSPREVERGAPSKANYVAASSRKAGTSFWRTGKGIVVMVVAAVVILAAVIGGAVGGTVGKSKPKNLAGSPTSSSSSSTPSAPVGRSSSTSEFISTTPTDISSSTTSPAISSSSTSDGSGGHGATTTSDGNPTSSTPVAHGD